MYGFASDYHLPHDIVSPYPLNLKLGTDGLEAEVLVEIQRDDTGVAPQQVRVVASHMVEAGIEKIAAMAFSAYLWGRGHPAQAEGIHPREPVAIHLRRRLRVYACDTYEPLALKRTAVKSIRVLVAGVDEVLGRLAGAQQKTSERAGLGGGYGADQG